MYWDDLKRLLRRNIHPHSILKFYPPSKSHPNNMTVCDMNLPRRRSLLKTGWTEEDWAHQSLVCVAHFENGEIPMRGSTGTINSDGSVTGQYRGVLSLIDNLLADDVIVMTEELRNFLRSNDGLYREHAHRPEQRR